MTRDDYWAIVQRKAKHFGWKDNYIAFAQTQLTGPVVPRGNRCAPVVWAEITEAAVIG